MGNEYLYTHCWKCGAPTKDGATLCNGGLYCPPKFWVYEGDKCIAAQSQFYGALKYMGPGRMIVTERRKDQT
jgi:hypothetical protein